MTDRSEVALVVDDSPVNRKLLGKLLDSLAIELVEAADGRTALAQLREAPGSVDVVLLDIEMPEMDGYATLTAIKDDESLRHLPVIMVSSVDQLDSVVRCIELGAADYLPKPFNPAILAARIRSSLNAKRLRDLERDSAARQAELLRTIELQKEELSRFLSPQVAALVSSPDGQQLLAGHRRLATSVFCDLRNFTPFSETAEPEEVLGVLRQYHATMGELILEWGGTLEHFAGDGMMVFFNDPVEQDDHVERAVRMAVAMRERFDALARGWSRHGHTLGFGVGIDTGFATLGRIGFEGRYDYGMIGHAVITAARLSSAAAAGQILLAPRAYGAVESVIDAEAIGEIQLKGFSRPIAAMNVLGLRDARVETVASA
jgi:adenylate cyclase